MDREILNITKENFAPFGKIIEFSEDCNDKFEIVITEETNPWRIAVYRYKEKGVKRMENHPTSKESFEPLTGVTLLMVAENESPEEYKVFLLDKPICLYEGVWHQVMSLSDGASVKITENLEVNSEFYEFENEVKIRVK